MKRLVPALCLLLLAPATSRAQTETQIHSATAASSIRVEDTADGPVIHQRSVRFELFSAVPDDIKVGSTFPPRIAAITATKDGVTDGPTETIEVIVDDISGPGKRRITAFTDPGREGIIAGGRYFIATGYDALARHRVRNLETGTPLFTSTGGYEAGTAVWMDIPNHHPGVERWAAFEGLPEGYQKDPSLLGIVRYGDHDRALTTLALHMDPARQPQDFQLDLPSCGALLWRELGKTPAKPARPAAEQCYDGGGYAPNSLFSLEHQSGLLGGFELELSYEGKVLAVIPVAGDRLDASHATLEPGMTLVPQP